MNKARVSVHFLCLMLLATSFSSAADTSLRWFLSTGLGFYATRLTEDLARDLGIEQHGGLLVLVTIRGAPADRAGVKRGDVLLKWSEKIWSDPGVSEDVVIMRDGRQVSLPVLSRKLSSDELTLLHRPKFEAARQPLSFIVDARGSGNFRTLTAALFRALPGDTILIKKGVYAESVLLQPRVNVRAAEIGSVTFSADSAWLLNGTGPTTLSGLTFSGAGLAIENGAEVLIQDTKFLLPNAKFGIMAAKSKVNVLRCTFQGGTGGVRVSGSVVSILESVFTNARYAAIDLTSSSGKINANLLSNNAYGLIIRKSIVSAASNLINGTWTADREVADGGIGISLFGSGAKLARNSVRGFGYGVWVEDASGPVTIKEHTVTQGGVGIYLESSGGEVSDSLILHNSGDGIQVDISDKEAFIKERSLTLLRNTVSANGGNGIDVFNYRRALIRQNLVEANAIGISIDNSEASVENNTVVLQRGHGVFIDSGANVVILNNIIALNSFGLFIDIKAQHSGGFNNVYGNLASTEFPLIDGNYGRVDRYVTTDGKRIPLRIYPAYDLKTQTDLSVDPGFVDVGSDYSLKPDSALFHRLGKDKQQIGAYARKVRPPVAQKNR